MQYHNFYDTDSLHKSNKIISSIYKSLNPEFKNKYRSLTSQSYRINDEFYLTANYSLVMGNYIVYELGILDCLLFSNQEVYSLFSNNTLEYLNLLIMMHNTVQQTQDNYYIRVSDIRRLLAIHHINASDYTIIGYAQTMPYSNIYYLPHDDVICMQMALLTEQRSIAQTIGIGLPTWKVFDLDSLVQLPPSLFSKLFNVLK